MNTPEMITECEAWFKEHFGFRKLPIRREQIFFVAGSSKRQGGYYSTLPRLRKSLLYSLIFGLFVFFIVTSFGLLSASEQFNLVGALNLLLACLLIAVSYGAPVIFLITRGGKIVVRSDGELEDDLPTRLTLIHELAHAYHNSNGFREYLHSVIDIILFPLFLSYMEGIAVWVEKEYCISNGIDFRHEVYLSHPLLRYRLSYRVAALCEILFGRKTVSFFLRYL